MKLLNQVALVTGAGRGIGRAIALRYGKEGASIAVNYEKNRDAAEEVAEALRQLGRSVLVVQADVSRSEHVREMMERVMEAFGRLDILVNNAGVARRVPFLQITEQEWDRTLDVALTNAPAGKYKVKFTIRDQNSKKTADFAKDVTIK